MTPYPRPVHRDPHQIDADIRNGVWARKARAHADAVTAWWNQNRPPIGRLSPAFPRTRQHMEAA